MNDIQIFKNPQFGEIRTAGTADNPVFCLSDVCKACGLSTNGISRRLQDEVISNHPIQQEILKPHQWGYCFEDSLPNNKGVSLFATPPQLVEAYGACVGMGAGRVHSDTHSL